MAEPTNGGVTYPVRDLLNEIKDDVRSLRIAQAASDARLNNLELGVASIKATQESTVASRRFLVTSALGLVMAITAVTTVILLVVGR